MKVLIYIEDMFEGSWEQFQNNFGFYRDELSKEEIEDASTDFCDKENCRLLCVTEVTDEHWKKMSGPNDTVVFFEGEKNV